MAIKAEIATVQFGPFSIEGLMSQDGDFGVAVSQLAALGIIPSNRSRKQLQNLLGSAYPIERLQKWLAPINARPVNVILLDDLEPVLFAMANRGILSAVKLWNQYKPDLALKGKKTTQQSIGREKRVELRFSHMYAEHNVQHQVKTDFGIADIVHDFGVVEVKQYGSISDAHKAIGQAMSYGCVLNRQPEVLLFDVPENEVNRVLRLFTAVGMIVLIFTKEGADKLLARKQIAPDFDNMLDIQSQLFSRDLGSA